MKPTNRFLVAFALMTGAAFNTPSTLAQSGAGKLPLPQPEPISQAQDKGFVCVLSGYQNAFFRRGETSEIDRHGSKEPDFSVHLTLRSLSENPLLENPLLERST
jgi:hypothetical protein